MFRRALTALVLAATLGFSAVPAHAAQPSDLDPAFGDAGVAKIAGIDPAASAVDGNGRIIIAGLTLAGPNDEGFALARLTADGDPDPAFNGGKTLVVNPTQYYDSLTAVEVTPDGGVVATGSTMDANNVSTFAVVRVDPTGKVQWAKYFPVIGNADGLAVAVAPDGKLVAAGQVQKTPDNYDVAVVQLQENGAPDTSFSGDGWLTTDWLAGDRAYATGVAVQPDGKVVVGGGTDSGPGGDDFFAARFFPDGAPDLNFGFFGKAAIPFEDKSEDSANALVLTPDGRVLLAGSSNARFALVRLLPDGNFDESFDGDGKVVTDGPDPAERIYDAAVTADGRIVATGMHLQKAYIDPMLARYLPDGSLDTTFDGGDGIVFDGLGDHAGLRAVAIDPAGRIVAAGDKADGNAVVARYLGAAANPPLLPPPPGPSDGGGAGRSGYWLLGSTGNVHAFGDAAHLGDAPQQGGGVDIEPTPFGNGYWVLDATGRVHTFGDAAHFGDRYQGLCYDWCEYSSAISATPTGKGYWLFTNSGRAFAFGDAAHHGDMAGTRLNGEVIDSVATPTGKGYYMVAEDGGVFAFGDADFHGSMGAVKLNKPVQSLVPDPDGVGYWLVASDGGVFAFEAGYRGSLPEIGVTPAKPVTGMVAYGDAYAMVATDGGVFNFSSLPFYGSLGANPPPDPIRSVAALD